MPLSTIKSLGLKLAMCTHGCSCNPHSRAAVLDCALKPSLPFLFGSYRSSGGFLPGQSPPGSTCLHIAGWKGYTDMCKSILIHWVSEHFLGTAAEPGVKHTNMDCRSTERNLHKHPASRRHATIVAPPNTSDVTIISVCI